MASTWANAAVEVEDLALPIDGAGGRVLVRIFRAGGIERPLPVVLCTVRPRADGDHDDRVPRALAAGIPAAVLVAEQPDALEQLHGVLLWIAGDGGRRRLDGTRIALVGDELTRNQVAALSSLTESSGGPRLRGVVTIAAADTAFRTVLAALARALS